MCRQILGAVETTPLGGQRPRYLPKPKALRGSRAAGIGYERKVGRLLSRLWPDETFSGHWFEFEDAYGRGCCQPDHFVVLDGQVLLVECKLTENPTAWEQIRGLYRPVLAAEFGLPVTGVQACKHLKRSRCPIVDVREALKIPGGDFLWHYLG